MSLAFALLSLFAAASTQAAGSVERGKSLMESVVAHAGLKLDRR